MSTTVLVRGTVTMHEDQCKGCELCVPACRPGVLRMTVISDPETCPDVEILRDALQRQLDEFARSDSPGSAISGR